MKLIPVAYADEIRPGECKVVTAGKRKLALINISGSFYATANDCPHRGGPLGDGHMDGEELQCPWHDWKFNVITGQNNVSSKVTLQTFKTSLSDDRIWVEI